MAAESRLPSTDDTSLLLCFEFTLELPSSVSLLRRESIEIFGEGVSSASIDLNLLDEGLIMELALDTSSPSGELISASSF